MIRLEQKVKLTDTDHFIGLWVGNPLFKKETERCQEGSRRRRGRKPGRHSGAVLSLSLNTETVVSLHFLLYSLNS